MKLTLLKMAAGAALVFAVWGYGGWRERAGDAAGYKRCQNEQTAADKDAQDHDINTRKKQNEIQNMDITPAAFDDILRRGAL